MIARADTPCISLAVRAWNEEAAIRTTLESLFQQSLFGELMNRGDRCEILCIANGCTDQTAAIAAAIFAEQQARHPCRNGFSCRVVEIAQAGRNNTWNAFVHSLSHPAARFLYLMDADIVFNRSDTLYNLYAALLNDPHACVAGDRQYKDIHFKSKKTLGDWLSLATSEMTRTIQGQITGQLYCIRAEVARRLHLPRDLGAPDDGFIKAVVCSNFFTTELDPSRIIIAENASHVYQAYRTVTEVLNNQKRQMIGQTTVHVLLEYLRQLDSAEKADLVGTLKKQEEQNPDWLKDLIHQHIQYRARCFWQLFPDVLTFRLKRWWRLRGLKKLLYAPAAWGGLGVTLIACLRAHRHLRNGLTHYWPKASRDNLHHLPTQMGAPCRPPAPATEAMAK